MKVLKRFAKYLEILESLPKSKKFISSNELADIAGVTPAVVRQDFFSWLNIKGKSKIGYNVSSLKKQLTKAIGIERKVPLIVLGLNHMSKALYYMKNKNIEFKAFFDDDSNEKQFEDIKVYKINELRDYLKENPHIKIAIITISPDKAEEVFNKAKEAGIKYFWNLSKILLKESEGIVVKNECIFGSLFEIINEYKTNSYKGGEMEITVCVGSSCHLKGSEVIIKKLQDYLRERHSINLVLKGGFCMGHCSEDGITVKFEDKFYKVTPETVDEFIKKRIEPKIRLRG